MKATSTLLKIVVCCLSVCLLVKADIEWYADYDDDGSSLDQLLSTNTSQLFSSSFVSKTDGPMYENFKKYVTKKKTDSAKFSKGMICAGKDAIFKNSFSMNYQYMCYDENANADCAIASLYMDWLYVKKNSKKNFECNLPCGCWVGMPKVHKAKFYIRTTNDDWKDLSAQLDKWGVDKEMKQMYKSASLFEGAGFQTFDFFARSGNSASWSMALGAVHRTKDGKLEVGFVEAASTAWLANKWRTKRQPYNEYEQVCRQEYDSRTQNWENVCRQEAVYKGDTRIPKDKGPRAISKNEIIAINNALQHVAFGQLKTIIADQK